MENLVDNRKINNDAWLERKYLQTLRNKILVSFMPFYCSNMNIEIFDKSVTQPCVIHNNVNINKQHYGILLHVQNIIKWIDSKYCVNEENGIQTNNNNRLLFKTSYIHNRDVTTRLHLHCKVPTTLTTSNNSNKQNAQLQCTGNRLHANETEDISDVLSDIQSDICSDILFNIRSNDSSDDDSDAQPDAQPDVQSDDDSDAQSVVQSDDDSDAQSVVQSDDDSDAQPDVQSDDDSDAQSVVQSDDDSDAQSVVQSDDDSDAQPDGDSDVQSDDDSDAQSVVQSDDDSDAQSVVQSDDDSDAQPDGDSDVQSDDDSDAQPDVQSDVQSDDDSDAQSDVQSDDNSNAQPDDDSDAQPDVQSDDDSDDQSDIQPVSSKIIYKKTDKSSSSNISNAIIRKNISPISVLKVQKLNEIDAHNNQDGKVKTKYLKERKIETLNSISLKHPPDTSLINAPKVKINKYTNHIYHKLSSDEESNGVKTSNLGTPPKIYVSSSESDKSDQEVKSGNKSKKPIIRKRLNSVSKSVNESKKTKFNDSFNSDNDQGKKKKVGEITKGDLCSVIFRKCAVLEKKSSRSSSENLNSAQESNDDINSEKISNLDMETSAVGYDSSSSASEQSNKRVKASKMSLKNIFARQIDLTARYCDNEPTTSKNNELSGSTSGFRREGYVQNIKEKTQNYTAFPERNLANSFKTKSYKSIYLRNSKGETQLHTACAKKNHSLVISLLSQGFNPNVKDNAGWTPMHEAVKMECLDTIKELIKYGAYLNAPGFEYETPLFTALKYNKNNVAALLLQSGADTRCKNIYGISAQFIDEDNWSKLITNYRSPNKSLQIKRSYIQIKCNLFLSNISINKAIVNKFCKRFDIKLIKNMDKGKHSQVTHIIVEATENNTCDVNLECLIGIANGLFIVNENWIIDSLKQDTLINCENYEVIGTKSSATNGPRRSRLDKEKLRPKLFDGINIHIAGNIGWNQFSHNELHKLIQEFGGKILKRLPNPEDCANNIIPYHCHNNEQMYSVSNIILYPKDSSRLIKYNMEHLKAFPLSWFFEAMQTHSII